MESKKGGSLYADTVIVEAEKLVARGAIGPENVRTPGVYVDYVVKGGRKSGSV